MNANQQQDDFPEVQADIYRVALSLDAFLLNGIPYGVLQRTLLPGFLEKTADNLLMPLANLEQHALEAPAFIQLEVREALGTLRTRCQQLIDLTTSLTSFKTLPLDQMRSAVSQIRSLRQDCVRLLQELEVCFRTPNPFYSSRPSHSTASINAFLANLEHMFEAERTSTSGFPA
jgi:hypothetical protein